MARHSEKAGAAMVEIHRIWPYMDTENNDRIALFGRPCVSIHVDEYIREEFDGLKPKIGWSIVESFPFGAFRLCTERLQICR